jgi:hypothetical protein
MGEESGPFDGWPILLAHHDPFVSSYLERALGRAGATVIGAYASEHALAGLVDWSGFGACLVSIRYHAVAERGLSRCRTETPLLVVIGEGEDRAVESAAAVFTYPFACYQVIDALARLKSEEIGPEARIQT